jgi:hypothetical protein
VLGLVLMCRLHDKYERFLLVILFLLVKIPELLLRFPPLDDAAETGDSQQDLDIPVTTMPVWMLVPSLADCLNTLHKLFTNLRLRSYLADGHVHNIRGHGYDIVQGGHDGIDGVVDKNTG